MNSSEVFNKIIQITGREPTECNCLICQKQCRTPCLGTPHDILNLIRSGYKKQIKLSFWATGLVLGFFPDVIPMFQTEQTSTGCIFFKNGSCSLHNLGLKPTEGKLSFHTITDENRIFRKSLTWNVAKEWLPGSNDKVITEIIRLMMK